MFATNSPTFLSRALLLDATASGATVLLLLLGGSALAGLLGLPEALLRCAALVMIPFVALVAWAASRDQIPSALIWMIIGANLAWVVASVLLLLTGWVQPTMLGYGFVLGQAVAVAVFAELQILGLRKVAAPSSVC